VLATCQQRKRSPAFNGQQSALAGAAWSTLPSFLQKSEQGFRWDKRRAGCIDRFLDQGIRRRNGNIEPRTVFARESFDNRVRRLTPRRVEYLNIVWIRLGSEICAASIENDCDIHARPILVMPKPLDQFLPGQWRTACVHLAQVRPGKNDAVAVDDKISRAHSIM